MPLYIETTELPRATIPYATNIDFPLTSTPKAAIGANTPPIVRFPLHLFPQLNTDSLNHRNEKGKLVMDALPPGYEYVVREKRFWETSPYHSPPRPGLSLLISPPSPPQCPPIQGPLDWNTLYRPSDPFSSPPFWSKPSASQTFFPTTRSQQEPELENGGYTEDYLALFNEDGVLPHPRSECHEHPPHERDALWCLEEPEVIQPPLRIWVFSLLAFFATIDLRTTPFGSVMLKLFNTSKTVLGRISVWAPIIFEWLKKLGVLLDGINWAFFGSLVTWVFVMMLWEGMGFGKGWGEEGVNQWKLPVWEWMRLETVFAAGG